MNYLVWVYTLWLLPNRTMNSDYTRQFIIDLENSMPEKHVMQSARIADSFLYCQKAYNRLKAIL